MKWEETLANDSSAWALWVGALRPPGVDVFRLAHTRTSRESAIRHCRFERIELELTEPCQAVLLFWSDKNVSSFE